MNGILESSLYVDHIDRSAEFYEEILGFTTLFRNQRICAMNVAGTQVFLLFKKGASRDPSTTTGGVVPGHDGKGILHVAFAVSTRWLEEWKEWLEENQVVIESTVHWGHGGTSLYFRDPDHHVIELATPGTWANY
ncbi:MAG: VOC family protein [Candidatus Krumholzibacteria bacterium]|nr:VOC family protein [Candidatus Krumholzibacteria bacterium]